MAKLTDVGLVEFDGLRGVDATGQEWQAYGRDHGRRTYLLRVFPFYKSGRYYRRHRALPVVASYADDGTPALMGEVDALITRLGWQERSTRRPHDVYWSAELDALLSIESVLVPDGEGGRKYVHAFVPFTGDARDRYRDGCELPGIHATEGMIDAVAGGCWSPGEYATFAGWRDVRKRRSPRGRGEVAA